MEARAPSVVAVVVTTGSAPGLEATLSTLVSQDYPELSLLVVANGGDPDVVTRVAAVAPLAFVKILEENRGFAAACNEAALMVQGSALLLFCHDDVLLFEGAVSQLVEAAFRANAGIVTPKVVSYEDPFILLHVGQVADRFGTVRERVEVGEIDHGQQDLERDVFVAPGGVTLVRTDLFETLGGFDPLIPAFGEDLDLCWRAQVAGARIIIAPGAVIGHRQTLTTGERLVSALGTRRSSPRDLERRHHLATVLTCWGFLTLLAVIPSMIALDVAEGIVALIGRDTDRAGAIAGSWRWVWRTRRHLRVRRRELAKVRVLRDRDIARLQVGGASRVRTFVTTLFHDGFDRARGILPELAPLATEPSDDDPTGIAALFSEDENFDEIAALDDSGRRQRLSRLFTGARSQLVLAVIVGFIWMVGARNLVATPLPNVGRLAPLDSWWSTWRHFFASWSPNGVGTGTPGMPGYGVLGFFGTFVLGRMGALPRLMLIFAVPVGSLGVWRLLGTVVSNRARLIAAIAYAAFPVGLNLIAGGRIDALVTVAVLPFAARRIFVLVNIPGWRLEPLDEAVAFGHRGWGRSRSGQVAVLILQVALMTAMAPAALVAALMIIIGVVLTQRLSRSRDALDRPWGLAGNVLVGTAVLLLPLTYDTVAAGPQILSVFGLRSGPWTALSISQILRGADGAFGGGWGAWLVPIVALAAVVLARGERRRQMAAALGILVSAVVLIVLVGRNTLGSFAPDVVVLMVLVSLSVSILVGIAVASVESDFTAKRFDGVRVGAVVVVGALIALSLPFIAQSSSGRFDLPFTGAPETLGSTPAVDQGGYRILWLGEPDALPLQGWEVAPGLALATSTDTMPDGSTLFSPPDDGAASVLVAAVHSALMGQTVRLGQLIAADGISTIVVMSSPAPSLSGLQNVVSDPPPANLLVALRRQSDLALSERTPGLTVFANSLFHGVVAERPESLSSSETTASPDSVVGWRGILDFGTRSGFVTAGTVIAALAPASAFELQVNGANAPRAVSLGGVALFNTPAGTARLVLHQLPINAVIATITLALWLTFALGFGALENLERLVRRRRRIRGLTDEDPRWAP